MHVAVIGLGKLGSPIAAVFASKGHDVWGCDVDTKTVLDLDKGIASVEETGLQALLNEDLLLSVTTDLAVAVENAEIVFIIVPTPSLGNGSFSTTQIYNVLLALAACSVSVDYQVIAIVSTVSPGSMNEIREMYEDTTGKTCGIDFGLVYNPEFIALGSIIHDLLNPSFILIGEEDKKSGDILTEFYATINSAPAKRMSFASAEIAKLGLNVALTQRISYANSISELCEKYLGANAIDALGAIGADRRIGPAYMRSGSAYGGPCFPRDCRALKAAAEKVKCQSLMAEAADEVNRWQLERIVSIVEKVTPNTENSTVGVLGLTYKVDTHITEESAGLILSEYLLSVGYTVRTYDPQAPSSALGLEELLNCGSCSVLIVMTPWPEFRSLPLPTNSEVTLIDAWGIVDQQRLPLGVKYVQLGVGE